MALDAGDAVAYGAAVEAIKTLTELTSQLKANAYLERRNEREQEKARRQELAKNRKLVTKILEIDPTTNFDVSGLTPAEFPPSDAYTGQLEQS